MQVRLKITGHVQGVFFRAEAQDVARSLGLTGWVRNTNDGGVEVLAQGDEDKLKTLIAWCERGPNHANVENAHVEWSQEQETFGDFKIR